MEDSTSFDINVVEYPAKRLVGFHVLTTIPRAAIDCPPLWEKFKTQLRRLPGGMRNPTYGLHWMVDKRVSFDHWAAAAVPEDFEPLKGMDVLELPAGLYVKCSVPNRAETLMAYSAVFGNWVQEQDDYDVDMQGPCFELYPPKWKPSEPFDLYASVIVK